MPAGAVHLRLLDALDQHQPLELVRCPNDATTDRPSSCVTVGGPLGYGDLVELDGADLGNTMGWRLAASAVGDPVVNPMPHVAGAAAGDFVTSIPVHVLGPANGFCPSCSYAEF